MFILLGVTLALSTSMITDKDIQYRLNATRAECIITDPRLAEAVDSVENTCPLLKNKILVCDKNTSRPGWKNYQSAYEQAPFGHECENTKSSDKLQIFFTSGTSGHPKKVVHSHATQGLALFYLGRYPFNLDRRVVFWNIADTGWAKSAWSSLFAPLIQGATIFIHAMPQLDLQEIIRTMKTYPINIVCAPPTIYRMLLPLDVPKLQNIRFFAAGEPLHAEVIKKWEKLTGVAIRQGYGQTEFTTIIGYRFNVPIKYESMGKRTKWVDVKILDDNYQPAPAGEIGHIAIKVPEEGRQFGLFLEYEDEPEKTAASIINGYYITGDKAHEDEEGYFYFHSRSDDVITSSAYRIGPFEVESAILGHPDVLESGVVGSPDPIRGEVVKAFIVLKESGKKKDPEKLKLEIQEHVKKTTAPYKYPRKIEFLESLPKTTSGKVKRVELKQREIENAKRQN